ncbi:hypothetical protein [Natronoglycomyces albus]|uniref:DUF2567 domain-containing protein n=1 Tax=Natronoglycomyces albus TaxID=2811108 RepID=A0A895XFY6_9ACTN|nr:hypothetical protein [Natronoglycomyces albus]QSB04244.1 hypothetical protein JQS30_10555 [Natronoglycomyces albus]
MDRKETASENTRATGEHPEPSSDFADEPSPEKSPPPDAARKTLAADTRAAALLAVVLGFFGLPLAVLWQALTPRVEIVRTERSWAPTELDPAGFVLADLNFAAIGLIAGIIAAILVWNALRARRGPIILFGLVVGSLACQIVAWRFGSRHWEAFWDAVHAGEPGWTFMRPAQVRMADIDLYQAWSALSGGDFALMTDHLQLGVLATMALAAAFTYAMCAGWSRGYYLRERPSDFFQER